MDYRTDRRPICAPSNNLAADGRLADVQGDLRCGESAAFRDRHEDREHVEIGLVKTRGGSRACWQHTCSFMHINIL